MVGLIRALGEDSTPGEGIGSLLGPELGNRVGVQGAAGSWRQGVGRMLLLCQESRVPRPILAPFLTSTPVSLQTALCPASSSLP